MDYLVPTALRSRACRSASGSRLAHHLGRVQKGRRRGAIGAPAAIANAIAMPWPRWVGRSASCRSRRSDCFGCSWPGGVWPGHRRERGLLDRRRTAVIRHDGETRMTTLAVVNIGRLASGRLDAHHRRGRDRGARWADRGHRARGPDGRDRRRRGRLPDPAARLIDSCHVARRLHAAAEDRGLPGLLRARRITASSPGEGVHAPGATARPVAAKARPLPPPSAANFRPNGMKVNGECRP
jgi:hypothetical protein